VSVRVDSGERRRRHARARDRPNPTQRRAGARAGAGIRQTGPVAGAINRPGGEDDQKTAGMSRPYVTDTYGHHWPPDDVRSVGIRRRKYKKAVLSQR